MADELKPCPFCGSEAEIFHHPRRSYLDESWHIECIAETCGCGTCHHETKDGAIATWNNRVAAVGQDTRAKYHHVKRGTTYTVIGEAELQMSADDLCDGALMVVYRGDDGKLWVRSHNEFHDGRFEAIG